jgi:hypothetical protein
MAYRTGGALYIGFQVEMTLLMTFAPLGEVSAARMLPLSGLELPSQISDKMPFAMGLGEHLDEFAAARGATTWKDLPDVMNWKEGVLEKLRDPNVPVHFNLDGVDVWEGVQRAASGRGGATDWELLQIKQSPQFWNSLHFWKNGAEAPNPFR